jgi:hypothetical protein
VIAPSILLFTPLTADPFAKIVRHALRAGGSILRRLSHQLKLTLEGVDPPVWRRLVVPSTFSLYELHCVVQVAMGWDNSHLHDFTIKRQRYTLPDPDEFGDPLDETKACLRDVARARTKILYQYDYGDSWNHVIVVEKVLADGDAQLPTCVDGARACPPEDSGGAWGYSEKLEVLADPNDPDYEDVREWMGKDFDPEKFSVDDVNRQLEKVFRPTSPRKRSSGPRKKRNPSVRPRT